jgi:ribosomal protein L27
VIRGLAVASGSIVTVGRGVRVTGGTSVNVGSEVGIISVAVGVSAMGVGGSWVLVAVLARAVAVNSTGLM